MFLTILPQRQHIIIDSYNIQFTEKYQKNVIKPDTNLFYDIKAIKHAIIYILFLFIAENDTN